MNRFSAPPVGQGDANFLRNWIVRRMMSGKLFGVILTSPIYEKKSDSLGGAKYRIGGRLPHIVGAFGFSGANGDRGGFAGSNSGVGAGDGNRCGTERRRGGVDAGRGNR